MEFHFVWSLFQSANCYRNLFKYVPSSSSSSSSFNSISTLSCLFCALYKYSLLIFFLSYLFNTGTSGCWTRVEPGSARLEPLGASQELRLDQVLYQEAGEYRCVAPSRDSLRRLDSLRTISSVQVTVSGKYK